MKDGENRNGHTLLVKCECGSMRLLCCASKSVLESEEHKMVYCPSCGSDFLTFVRVRGKHSLEEMKGLLNG